MQSFMNINAPTSPDHEEHMLNLALIQYLFTEGEHEVKVAPHGNSKQREGFVRKCTEKAEERCDPQHS